jgi:hypothetical protein
LSRPSLFDRDFSQPNALDRCPDNSQATHLGREYVDLIGTLTHEAPETFDGVSRPDVAVQRLRKVVEGERLVFLLGQAPDSLWIEPAVFGECSQSGGSGLPPW